MVSISGVVGRVYAGYQEAAVLGTWHIAYDDAAGLGDRRYGKGSAVIEMSNEFWRLMPITHIVLRMGNAAWKWSEVEVVFGLLCEFTIYGDPEVTDWRE